MRARIFAPFLAPGQPKPCRNRAAAMLLRPLVPPTPKGCLRLMQRRIQRVALVLIYWPAGYLCDLPVIPLTPAWVGIMPVWAMVLVVGKVVSPVWSNSVYLGRRRRTCGPPTASQISASPYNRASRLDDDGRFGNHSHSGRRYFYRWRSLSHRGRCFLGLRWSLCCKGRRARCIKVGGFSRAQNCDFAELRAVTLFVLNNLAPDLDLAE